MYDTGPLHWCSKRQSITARSTAEAEIYATDECTKYILQLLQILDELPLGKNQPKLLITIFNDNNECLCWNHNVTTKGLRHIQIRENAVRESIQKQKIMVKHIAGNINLSDLFTKEHKDTTHFLKMRDVMMSIPPHSDTTKSDIFASNPENFDSKTNNPENCESKTNKCDSNKTFDSQPNHASSGNSNSGGC